MAQSPPPPPSNAIYVNVVPASGGKATVSVQNLPGVTDKNNVQYVKFDLGGSSVTLTELEIKDIGGNEADTFHIDFNSFKSDFLIKLSGGKVEDKIILHGVDEVVLEADGTRTITYRDSAGETHTTTLGITEASIEIYLAPDGVVDGTNTDDVMDIGYMDALEDTIDNSGNVIEGKGGSDHITGGAGDDKIYGDFNSAAGLKAPDLSYPGGKQGDTAPPPSTSNQYVIGSGTSGAVSISLVNATGGGDKNTADELTIRDGTFTDITEVTVANVGAAGAGDFDVIRFDLSTFDDDFLVKVKTEGFEDRIIFYNVKRIDDSNPASQKITYVGADGLDHTVTVTPGKASVETYGPGFEGATFDDVITGGAGNDTIYGGYGQDTIDGGADNDTIYGGDDADTLAGGSGDDLILGDYGKVPGVNPPAYSGVTQTYKTLPTGDKVTVSIVNDVSGTGSNKDVAEDVTFFDNASSTKLTQVEIKDIGDKTTDKDTLRFDLSTYDDDFLLKLGAEGSVDRLVFKGVIDLFENDDGTTTIHYEGRDGRLHTVTVEQTNAQIIALRPSVDPAEFAGYGDVISGGSGADTIDGGTGDDTIRASTGTDTIDGGDGRDTYDVNTSSTLVDERLIVSVNDDGDGTATKVGDGTTDTLTSIETFVADEVAGVRDEITLESVVDYRNVNGLITEINTTFASGTFTTVTGAVINFGPSQTYSLRNLFDGTSPGGSNPALGPSGRYSITGGDESGQIGEIAFSRFETINFRVGDVSGIVDGLGAGEAMPIGYVDLHGDTIDGADGIDDVIYGNDGNDTIDAGLGDDIVAAGAGDDTVTGNVGDDLILGDAPVFADLIVNGSFEDTTGLTAVSYGYQGSTLPGWTLSSPGTLDVHNDGRGGVDPTDGNNWLDTSNSPGNISVYQDVAGVVAGEAYALTFNAGDANDIPEADANSFEIWWGGERVAVIDPPPGAMQSYAFEVIGGSGDGSNRLEIRGAPDADTIGASIDEVRLFGISSLTTDGDDTLSGGAGRDIIYGAGGDDTINSADDAARPGDTGDQVFGGFGDDTITANGGDTVDGGEDPDDGDLDTLIVNNVTRVDYVDETGAPSAERTEAGTVTFNDGTRLEFSAIERVLVDPFTATDLILLSLPATNVAGTGPMPGLGDVLTTAGGELERVVEQGLISNANSGLPNLIETGDEIVLDGTLFEIRDVRSATATVEHEDGFGAPVTSAGVPFFTFSLYNPETGQFTSVAMPADGTALPGIRTIEITSTSAGGQTAAQGATDGDDDVSLADAGAEPRLFDAIRLSSPTLPGAGEVLTSGHGPGMGSNQSPADLVAVEEPIAILTQADPTRISVGDELAFDGLTYTVTQINAFTGDYTLDDTGVVAGVDGVLYTLRETLDGKTVVLAQPLDAEGNLPDIQAIAITSVAAPSGDVALASGDTDDIVTLDFPDQPAPAPAGAVFDFIRTDAPVAGAGAVLTVADGELTAIQEPLVFTRATPGQIGPGDTVQIGGITYTVASLDQTTAEITHQPTVGQPDGVTEAAPVLQVILTAPGEPDLSFLAPLDSAGDLPEISRIEILQPLTPLSQTALGGIDGNDSVSLDGLPDYILYDLVEIDALPLAGQTKTEAGGGLIQVREPVIFSTATPGQVALGDTTVIDGVEYTVTDTATWTGDVSLDSGPVVATTGALLVLSDGAGGTLTFALPSDDAGDLPAVSAISFASVQNADVPVEQVTADDNDFVTLICFAPQTHILTNRGEVQAAALKIGDKVLTRDSGYQQIRWIGRTTVEARGRFAPVIIRQGTFGNERDLVVSPQHRVLVCDWRAELMFGEFEVLVPAKHLLGTDGIYTEPRETMEYVHIMFDRHEVVFSEGIPTESFHPGDYAVRGLADDTRAELLALFPDLANNTESYGPAARLSLKKAEAEMLVGEMELAKAEGTVRRH